MTFEEYCNQNQVIEKPTEKQLQAIRNMSVGFNIPVFTPKTKEEARTLIGDLKKTIASLKRGYIVDDNHLDNEPDYEDNDWLDPIY
jgi:hypothetical protein